MIDHFSARNSNFPKWRLYLFSLGGKVLDAKAIILMYFSCFWYSAAPNPFSLASVCSINGKLASGNPITGGDISFFKEKHKYSGMFVSSCYWVAGRWLTRSFLRFCCYIFFQFFGLEQVQQRLVNMRKVANIMSIIP